MSFSAPRQLDLTELAAGTACLTPAVCANLVEAAVVCLTTKGHVSGVGMHTTGDGSTATVRVHWDRLDIRAIASHDDQQEATENGAVAIAIELVRRGTGLEVVRRSRKHTGFDWHLGHRSGAPPFAETTCLEVSGVLNETSTTVADRLRRKVEQVKRGGTGLPGFAVVVGFAGPCAAVRSL